MSLHQENSAILYENKKQTNKLKKKKNVEWVKHNTPQQLWNIHPDD